MPAISSRGRSLYHGQLRPTAVITIGDSYTMCLQSGQTYATVDITSGFTDSSGNPVGGNPFIELYKVPVGLTSGATNYGTGIIFGATESHGGFTTAGTLHDSLASAGVPTTRMESFQYAIGGTRTRYDLTNSWGQNVPNAIDNPTEWAAGTLVGAGNSLWTTTYTNWDSSTNRGLTFLQALLTLNLDIVLVMSLGGNDVFERSSTVSLLTYDQYLRPTGYNTSVYDDTVGLMVYKSYMRIINFIHHCVNTLNPHHPKLEVFINGYLNFCIDESTANTPIVDLPHGSALGGAGYAGKTDTTVDRNGFWGTGQVNPSFPFNNEQTAYTTAHDKGTGRFDPEYSSPYHTPDNAPQYTCVGDIVSAATGGRSPVPITNVGMVKTIMAGTASNATFWGIQQQAQTFYNRWYAHYETDVAWSDVNVDLVGSWSNTYNSQQSTAQSHTNVFTAVSTSFVSNDNIGRMFKYMLGNRYTQVMLDQRSLGHNVHYNSGTWDVLSDGTHGTVIGQGSSFYYSGPHTSYTEGVHPNGDGIGPYSDYIATQILANSALLHI